MAERVKSDDIRFDAEKFWQLILYFAEECKEDASFGSIMLNKMLFAADFTAYAELGKPITGATYRHLEQGPAPLQLMPIRQQMMERGDLDLVKVDYYGREQKRPVALKEADTHVFSRGEMKLCEYVVKSFCGSGGRDSTLWSHSLLGWLNTTDKEPIPYFTVFMWEKEPITQADIQWALQKLRQNQTVA